jgi:phosphoglycerate dehydrogenase-like enzyme
MQVTGIRSSSTSDEWDAVLTGSDVLCVILPTTDATHHLINAATLAKLKPGAMLINVGRGATIDTEALVAALKSGSIAGAAVDVYENEPMNGELPASIIELASLPTVVATPHIAYNTLEAAERLGDELLGNIDACLNGTPINVVN